jgi:hypothetical protein
LVGAKLPEQNDERAVQRARYMTLETIAPLTDNPIVSLPCRGLYQSLRMLTQRTSPTRG